MSEINVVPYIDVMLVLLIIFMVTAPLLSQGVKVDLPDAAAEPIDPAELQNRPPLILSVDSAGQLYLNQGEDPEAPLTDELLEARVAGIGGVATVVEKLSRAFLDDGKLSVAEINEAFNSVDKRAVKKR